MELVRDDVGASVLTPAGSLPLRWIACIGRNYGEHAREMASAAAATSASGSSEHPTVFAKSPASIILHDDEIALPACCVDEATGGPQVDYEGELAVVIGTPARDVSVDEALGYVLGYCCANDVSARWWQKHGGGGQFVRGKSFDTFCPLGPSLTPAQGIDPTNLSLTTRLNGEVVQHASTRDMIYAVPEVVSRLSQGATLPAGTVILTGTPSGVGAARTPPRYLGPGDVVKVEIEGLGVLRNEVVGA
ncbi:MAG: fumarylacetoacetate hydrolase family protein [Phycisphaerales bacterium]|jgi:2-keto-4-pentenoate hydratase/2-oxohepta-3-ene-1,7-dioic acid hydratase in catechol pathway